MQSVLIDIGLILIQIQEDTIGLYNIGLTFLPAFEAFSSGPMLGKLLSLYLDSLLPKLIHQKDAHTPITENDTKRPSQSKLKFHIFSQSKQRLLIILFENRNFTYRSQ
jgi:hypothetical protein